MLKCQLGIQVKLNWQWWTMDTDRTTDQFPIVPIKMNNKLRDNTCHLLPNACHVLTAVPPQGAGLRIPPTFPCHQLPKCEILLIFVVEKNSRCSDKEPCHPPCREQLAEAMQRIEVLAAAAAKARAEGNVWREEARSELAAATQQLQQEEAAHQDACEHTTLLNTLVEEVRAAGSRDAAAGVHAGATYL